MNDDCTWRATPARGVYKPSCGAGQSVMEVPPRPGSNCPYCGRVVAQFIPNKARKATMEEYRRYQAKTT
jgi:hypothetical protein